MRQLWYERLISEEMSRTKSSPCFRGKNTSRTTRNNCQGSVQAHVFHSRVVKERRPGPEAVTTRICVFGALALLSTCTQRWRYGGELNWALRSQSRAESRYPELGEVGRQPLVKYNCQMRCASEVVSDADGAWWGGGGGGGGKGLVSLLNAGGRWLERQDVVPYGVLCMNLSPAGIWRFLPSRRSTCES